MSCKSSASSRSSSMLKDSFRQLGAQIQSTRQRALQIIAHNSMPQTCLKLRSTANDCTSIAYLLAAKAELKDTVQHECEPDNPQLASGKLEHCERARPATILQLHLR